MNDVVVLADSQEIVVDEVFPHAPDVVWRTITTPELMARWLKMTATGFEATVGTRFTYQTTPAGAWDGVIRCLVLEVIPNQRLVYEWRGGHEDNVGYGSRLETVVTWSLSPAEGGVRVRLVHSGFRMPNNDHAYQNMSHGWPGVLQRIAAIAEEREAAPSLH